MSWIDWLVLVLPVCVVMGMGFYSRKYIRDITDYLAAGRVCGRYVLSLGDVANALSIMALNPARSVIRSFSALLCARPILSSERSLPPDAAYLPRMDLILTMV